MTQISISDVAHLATLSSLALGDTEAENLRGDIENILEHVNQLQQLDTSGVQPTYQVTDLENVWRTDTVDGGDVKNTDLVALAADSVDNQIKVPKVL